MNKNGSHWIRPTTRQRIYMRDGCCCVYCGRFQNSRRMMGLDHVVPREDGGSNRPDNLVTCCRRCNDLKGTKPLALWRPDLVGKVQEALRAPLPAVRSEQRTEASSC